MDKILIIQPHSDDAILSCSNFIFGQNFKTKVLTIEKNDKRIAEDRLLSDYIGVKYFNLGVEVIDDYYSEFFKVNGRNVELSDSTVIPFYVKRFGKDKVKELRKVLNAKIDKYINKGYIIVCPLGIGHPFHYFVRYLLRKIENSFIFYREFPHSYKRKAQVQFGKELNRVELLLDFNDNKINELKYILAQKFYKTQSGFFFYEHSNLEKLYPEEYYIYKSKENEAKPLTSHKKEIKIYVISKDRPNGKTFYFLKLGKVDYTVVVEPQDYEKYKKAGHEKILVLPENDRGFSYTVNYSKSQYDGINPVVIMDDDILNFFYNYSGNKKISLSLKTGDEISKFFKDMNDEICNTDFDIGTIGKSAFDWSNEDINPRIAYPGSKIRYSGLPVVIIINNKDLLKFNFDEKLCFKSDIDYSLKCMYLGFRYAKFIRFLQQTKMNKDGKQEGGLSETYKNSQKIINSQDILLNRWPDNIIIDEKKKANNGVSELRIIYKISSNTPTVIKNISKKLLK